MDLEESMLMLQHGKQDALEEIYHATKQAVYAAAFSVLRESFAAEDIMQDTYLQLIKKIRKYKPKGTPLAWICVIARNLALNYIKKNKRIIPSEKLPEKTVPFEEPLGIMDIAAKVLNKKELEVVALKTGGGFTHKEIAQILKIPHDTIRWQYHSAIGKLKKYIEKENNV